MQRKPWFERKSNSFSTKMVSFLELNIYIVKLLNVLINTLPPESLGSMGKSHFSLIFELFSCNNYLGASRRYDSQAKNVNREKIIGFQKI